MSINYFKKNYSNVKITTVSVVGKTHTDETAGGSLLGLYASRLPHALIEAAIDVKKNIDLPQIPLSDRQLVIAGMLERGFNNAEIALEIGYSESLIRQETVSIYGKLQVTGRKAMQAIRTFNLETAAHVGNVSELDSPD